MQRRVLLILAASLSMGVGCAEKSSKQIVITGSSTIAPLMLEIAKRYEAQHPGLRVEVQSGGSSRGVADVRSGVAQIGMVSRALNKDEADLKFRVIAKDGVALILHKSNPVTSLKTEDVVGIYTGKIKNWSEVGGPDAPITVVNKAEGRSTLELFLKHFKLDNKQVQAQVVIGENEQGIKTVAQNQHAIGYVSVGTAEYDVGHGVPIKLLPLNGVDASLANVRTGSFPMSRPLNLVFADGARKEVLDLVAFAGSPQTHDLIQKQSFVVVD